MEPKRKIAFITFGHWGSTIPLAKQFCNEGFDVDYYIECFNNRVENLEATDTQVYAFKGIEGSIPDTYLGSLKDYNPNVSYKYLRLVSPLANHSCLSYISRVINFLLIYYLSYRLNSRAYEYVILVGRHTASHFEFYHRFLKGQILTCLHEVCDRYRPNFKKPSTLLRYLFTNEKRIIVHSKNTLNDLIKFPQCNKELVYNINFGLFETWKYCAKDKSFEKPIGKDYILFIGGIDDYKGLDVLCQTICLLREQANDTQFVIAGRGFVNCLDEMKSIPGVTIINRFLSNTEFATLIYNSRAIICPYKRMSQSGIPQSAFVFSKPVIVSDLDGFREVVIDDVTGMICHAKDAASFAKAINNIYLKDTYDNLVDNLNHFDVLFPEMSWLKIMQNYLSVLSA